MSKNLISELNQLQLQLATIQEQQRLQKFMIKQFQEQLKSYQQKQEIISPCPSEQEEENEIENSSPLDLSSKSDEEHSTSLIEFQMESHEGEPENPNMSKLKDMIDKLERTTNKSDSNECVVCKRILSCHSALKMHYRTHTGERPFQCRICSRSFSTKGNLKTHMNIHRFSGNNSITEETSGDESQNDEKDEEENHHQLFNVSQFSLLNPQFFPFLAAAASLNQKKSLNLSILDEQKDNKIVSEDINQTRRSISTSQHMCNICSKNFSSASALQIHNRTHTGEKPYKCDVCGRAFTTKGNLKVHTGTHMYNTTPVTTVNQNGKIRQQHRRYYCHPYSTIKSES
ncbi:unnamed protein product [Adineta steineri]|uniref:C2H2-type domain-containing protein n=2 Tax=Adineta steineri TaxID=433720 RepID=A0A815IWD1_9BILA|nr:unnamed protein product [Adineta steineri]CAF1371052.1 unnamed protein product [Adineta steineri]